MSIVHSFPVIFSEVCHGVEGRVCRLLHFNVFYRLLKNTTFGHKKTALKIFNRQQYMCFDSTSQLDFLIIIVFDSNIETYRGDMHRNSQFPRKSVRNMILPPVLHT
jgi:hypothetical protein